MSADRILKPRDLDHFAFGCCSNREIAPFRCSQCGLPFAYCLECNTVYPSLVDTSRVVEEHNATDPSRPSHRCHGCGYVFEWAFSHNRKYRVSLSEWVAAGFGHLLDRADHPREPALPPELERIPWRQPWVPVADRTAFTRRLAQETGKGHVLYGRRAIAVGRRSDMDDFLFYLPDGPAMLAVVHLTFSERVPEPNPQFPVTALHEDVPRWIEKGLDVDARELGNPEE